MSGAALKYLADLMAELGVPYAFMRWEDQHPPDYYFVGDYLEEPSLTGPENGYQASTFILRGFTKKSWALLEAAKGKIERAAMKTAILDDGSGIAVFYDSAMPVPTGDMDLKSIKINLKVQEWKVR